MVSAGIGKGGLASRRDETPTLREPADAHKAGSRSLLPAKIDIPVDLR